MFPFSNIILPLVSIISSTGHLPSILSTKGEVTFPESIISSTVTPFLVGGKDSRSLVEGYGFSKIENAMKLKLSKVSRMKDELVLFYKI